MYLKLAVAILATLPPWTFMSGESLRATTDQSDPAITNKLSSGEIASMSDREKDGLRGPVELYTEAHTFPAVDNIPARTYTITTKFSLEGRILQSTNINASEAGPQEFSTTYTYDDAGRLLKKTSAGPGSPSSETKYSYDEKGRIISITGDPLGVSSFEYDDNGRKTRIMSAPSKPLVPEGTQYMFTIPEDEDSYLPIPTGGHAKILFNEQGQPVEWQVSDANGNLVNKLIRNYDENGRLAELRYTIESFLYLLPAEAQQELMADPGAAEEMAAQLTKILGEQRNFTRITYACDADGRLKHHYTGYSMEGTTKITYNDHSDKLEERQFTIGDPNPPRSPQPTEVSSRTSPYSRESHVQHSYKYDNFGNWTEQRTGSPTSASDWTVIRRTLIYFSPQSLEAETALSEQRGGQPFARRFLQRVGAFLAPR
jgi:YD repeat-containing protein